MMNGGGNSPGHVAVILGAQWGDEGKGKLVDVLCQNSDIVARCQGGNNAGHTVVANGKTYDFHILPSGIMHPNCIAVIGNGVVVHLPALFDELKKNGISDKPGWQKQLILSTRAHIVFDMHQAVDGMRESEMKDQKIGTTKKGIGPTYSSKAWRSGLRMCDLVTGDWQHFKNNYFALFESYKKIYPGVNDDCNADLKKYEAWRDEINKLGIVQDTVSYLHKSIKQGKSVLVEGANGALLDLDFGTYPFVTASNCTVGGACTGLGIPPTLIKQVIGIVKAYQTRVGAGPFPTELHDEIGMKLQKEGHEIGVTTGRSRRCGWLDLVLLRYSTIINGFTEFALTKIDVLDGFDEIKVCVKYKINGKEIDTIPACAADCDKIEPVYEIISAWKPEKTTGARTFEELPQNARKFVQLIEKFTGVKVKWIGVGQDREALIVR